ncbi:hypothetical protein [Thermaerobacillus caldiproteolyticus]|uniref:hypothetical protein n=1 Tax=Thermaerobacillus caldiproteolyticus TaxID=247480 RepID=UPI00188A86BD|nr:hypothetical protein [Anoxybacillus caldiproteolyticus]QPA30321.1 hypothetical protein ISX45_11845 [Anoxybacillus caldiproteolyticus]
MAGQKKGQRLTEDDILETSGRASIGGSLLQQNAQLQAVIEWNSRKKTSILTAEKHIDIKREVHEYKKREKKAPYSSLLCQECLPCLDNSLEFNHPAILLNHYFNCLMMLCLVKKRERRDL